MLSPDQHYKLRFFNPLSPKGSQWYNYRLPRYPAQTNMAANKSSRNGDVTLGPSLLHLFGRVGTCGPACGARTPSGFVMDGDGWTKWMSCCWCRSPASDAICECGCGAAPAAGLTKQMLRENLHKIKNSSVRLEKNWICPVVAYR